MRGPRSLPILCLAGSLLAPPVAAGDPPAAAADLPVEAFALIDAGRPLEAHGRLLTGLLERVAAGQAGEGRAAAEAELAARLLDHVSAELTAWPETVAALAPARPWPRELAPAVAAALERTYARGLRALGRSDEAAGVSADTGLVNGVWFVGPFDNERGRGVDVAYEPEQRFERERPFEGRLGEVRWRPNPLDHDPLLTLSPGTIVRPATQSVAYAATALRPLEAGPVVLRVGSTGPWTVFLDGHQLAGRQVERPFALDQDRVVLPLHAGWNQLLVKLAVEDGPWRAALRLTDLDGRPQRIEIDRAYTSWPEPPPDELMFFEELDDGWSPMDDPEFDWSSIVGLLAQQGVELPPELAELEGPELLEALMQIPEVAAMAAEFMGGGEHGPGGDGGPGGEHDPDAPEADTPGPDAGPSWPWPAGSVPDAGDAQPAPEAPQVLAALTADGDAGAARMLALWQLLVHPDDRSERGLRTAAERAVALDPDDVVGRRLLSLGLAPQGEQASERETNPWRLALLDVLARDPDHVGALLDLARLHLSESPLPVEADRQLERALELAPESWTVLAIGAERLEARGQPGAAEALRLRALASPEGAVRATAFLERADRAQARGDREEALAQRRAAFARAHTRRRAVATLFDQLVDDGRLDEALFTVERALSALPGDLELMLHAASRLEALDGPYPEMGREFILRALDVCPDDREALARLSDAELRAGDEQAAAQELRRLLEVDPSDEDARRRLAVLEGDTREPFWTPWQLDVRAARGRPRLAAPGEALEILDRLVVWVVHPDGTEHAYEHLIWRVLSDAGASRLADELLRPPSGARLTVTRLELHRADGRVEPLASPRARPSGAVPLQLPPLEPGDVVDVAWRIDQRVPDVFGGIFGVRHRFQPQRVELLPTHRSELVVVADAELPLQVAVTRPELVQANEERTDDGRAVRRWVARDLVLPPWETAMPPLAESVASVDVTSLPDWDAFADWWWHFIEKEFVTSPEMRRVVAELTDGLPDERARIEAVVRFVAEDVRYNSWPFGTHGYEPFSAATILERRFGDCKDKAILLRQMLGLIGVDCHPVLLDAERVRPVETLAVPFVGHFDHCIAWLPEQGLYVDATAPDNPLDYLRSDDQGARALHVTSDGGELRTIPYAPAEENVLERTWLFALTDDGGADAQLTDSSAGDFAVRLRRRLSGERDLERALGRLESDRLGAVEVSEVAFEPWGPAADVRLQARFAVDGLGARQGDAWALPAGLDPLRLEGLAAETPDERRGDVLLERPWSVRTLVSYGLPAGWAPRDLPADVRVELPGVLSYALELSVDEPGASAGLGGVHERFIVHARRTLEVTTRRIPRAGYAEFHMALADIAEAETRPILVGPGEASR